MDDATRARIEGLESELGRLRSEVAERRDLDEILLTMEWLATTRLTDEPLISVVVPTRNRRDHLERAVGSVLDQDYDHWELLIVDDGSTDGTSEYLDTLDDPRIRCLRDTGRGCAAARNVALADAGGSLVTYLDDDNTMHRLWLKGLAWASANWPDTDVFYGARIFDNFERAHGLGESGLPWLQYKPWDRDELEEFNIADVNVLAHRAGLPEAHYDEPLALYADWDILLRLTALEPPVRIPVIACAYSTEGDDRLSVIDDGVVDFERVYSAVHGMDGYTAPPGEQRTKVLLVAIDAFDLGVARGFTDEGDLPHLSAVFERSSRATVRSPFGIHSSAGWPSVSTGRSFSEHQRQCWIETGLDYEDRWTDTRDIDGTPFWEYLSRAGKRSAILDVPHLVPDDEHNGVQLIEYGCHDRHLGTQSVPDKLIDEIVDEFGEHPVGMIDPSSDRTFSPCDYHRRAGVQRTPEESKAVLDDLLLGQARKEAASLSLLTQGGWDLFMTVFGESHCTGHQLWSSHDPDHPWYDPAVVAEVGDPLRTMYRRLDRALGRHIAAAGDEATVLVMAPHGMGSHFGGTPLLDEILHRIELADAGGPQGNAATRAAKAAWARIPGRFDAQARRLLAARLQPRVADGDTPPLDLPPRRERRWFSPPCDEPFGPIRLNVVGRETHGIIRRGAEFDAACEHLRDVLLDLVNVETGERAVLDVVRSDVHYTRRPDDLLPDLFVVWNNTRPVEALYSPRTGLVVRRQTHWRSGDHPADGFLLAAGPGIEPDRDIGTIDARDVGPTVAALFGVSMPDATGTPVPLTRAVRSTG